MPMTRCRRDCRYGEREGRVKQISSYCAWSFDVLINEGTPYTGQFIIAGTWEASLVLKLAQRQFSD